MAQLQVLVVGSLGCARDVVEAGRGGRLRVNGPFPPSVAAAAGLHPDVIVLETQAPANDEPMSAARALFPEVAIVVVAESVDPRIAAEALAAGACGMLALGGDPERFAEALHRAAAGEVVITPELLAAMVTPAPRASDDGLGSLTARERQVLELVAGGVSTSQIASRLGISAVTVQSHVASVLAKLRVHSKVEAARVAWREGAAELTAGV